MKSLLFFTCVLFATSNANAQARPELYWVVETNKHQRDFSVVKFYDPEHNLVHEIKLDKRISIERKRDRQKLDQVINRYMQREVVNRKRTKLESSI